MTVEVFGDTTDVRITVLVDNRADLIVRSTDTVKAFTDEPLLAEHGFAALLDTGEAGVRILWDAGATSIALPQNLARMKIDPASIDVIALSHGHSDHTAALARFIRSMNLYPEPRAWKPDASLAEMLSSVDRRRVPVVAHPAAFRERWSRKKNGGWHGPSRPPPRLEWEASGAEIVLSEHPLRLGAGCWTTGSVPRLSFERSGIPKRLFYRDGDALVPDFAEDDQAIVVNVRGKGLVVLSGCAHSGIVNTIDYARKISCVERVWAVIGGFHLAQATEDEVERTVEELQRINPALVVPAHCTGFGPMCRIASVMRDAFVPSAVGMTFLF